jgi:tetratricopeptide (TPR) repeat protein
MLLAPGILPAQRSQTFSDCSQAEARIQEGRRLHVEKKYAAAIQEFRAAQELCPSDSRPGLEIIQSYLAGRQFASAEKSAKIFLIDHPDSQLAQFFLAYSYFAREQFSESAHVLQKLLQQYGQYEDAIRLAGMTEYSLHDYPKAVELLETAVRLKPDDDEALFFLGTSHYAQHDIRPAIEVFQQLLSRSPRSYRTYDSLGLCYETADEVDSALGAFRKAYVLARGSAPDYDLASGHLAEFLLRLGRPGEALPYAQEAVAIRPVSAPNQYYLGTALFASDPNSVNEALPHLKKATELNPNYAEAHYVLGRIYSQLNQREEANKEFEAYRKLQNLRSEHTAGAAGARARPSKP